MACSGKTSKFLVEYPYTKIWFLGTQTEPGISTTNMMPQVLWPETSTGAMLHLLICTIG